MKKHAAILSSFAIALTLNISNAGADNLRTGVEHSVEDLRALRTSDSGESPSNRAKFIKECGEFGVCDWYLCYETDNQSICKLYMVCADDLVCFEP